MSDAKKCDRCGKYYVRNKKTFNCVTYKGVSVLQDNLRPPMWFDLCDDCITELFEFLKINWKEWEEGHGAD